MTNLESIKHQFDIAINHLDLFFPLISSTNKNFMENVSFSMLRDAVQTFNLNYSYYIMGNARLEKVVSDSKLFLTQQQRKKFYQFAHDEVIIRKNHLQEIISQLPQLSPDDVIEIERIFTENFNIGIKGFPTFGIGHNSNFITDLVKATESYFEEFEQLIEQIRPKTKIVLQANNTESDEEGVTYLYKNGKRMMSTWNFLTKTGMLDRMAKAGITFNPVHDFEKLKPFRLEEYAIAKKSFIEEREINEVKTGDFELNAHFYSWYKSELNVISGWLSDNYPNGQKKRTKISTSDQIEILKYKQFVNSEMLRLEQLINSQSHTDETTNVITLNYSIESDTNIDRTKNIIIAKFAALDKNKGGLYAFDNDKDYNLFVEMLTCFFTYQHYDLPNQTIRLKKGCKTRLAKTLGDIHRELSNEKSLKGDDNFFVIVKKLNQFENESDLELYKALTR